MVTLEDAVIARLERHGEHFEILIDPDAVENLRTGREKDIISFMVIDKIFKDAKKGDAAAEETMEKAFESTDVPEIAMRILKEGTIQLTTEQKKTMQEEKRKRVVAEIAKNAVNPQTGTPHPPTRIEMAMEEIGIHIDPFKDVEVQVKDVVEKLRPVMPIRFEKAKIAVKVSGQLYGKLYGDITKFGKILKEEWSSTGDWIGVVEIPAGLQDNFFDMLNNKTQGNVETKLLKST